ncbi:MAG TPA: glycoside hydrolase, partial [Candidatus Aciduliprofundum boonei]|nr:glycoside hydrolase [Candidatus Aciduliprofundum boonei]
MKWKIHIVSHTHWDREWYLPFQIFRARLVKMIDSLLNILSKEADFRYFTLDGQTIVLEDYLEIRPDKAEELKKRIKEGRILIGPWYILPDEFLVSGESLIRNLILGEKIARKFGRVMRIGYTPDTFGHIEEMPQILRGFEIDNFVFWRGYTADEKRRSEF